MVEDATLKPTMFADSMLQVSRPQRSRRSWTALTSFGLQLIVIGLLLLLPLLRTVGLPPGRVLPTPLSWGTPSPPAPPAQSHVTPVVQSNRSANVLLEPRSIPAHIAQIEGTIAPPQVNYNDVGVNGGLARARAVASRDFSRILRIALSYLRRLLPFPMFGRSELPQCCREV
jgi:hypothetical protein